ncbi:MAG TPA: class I SAM-dependent methyltransferase [Candidatus Dormibacteraeota bacterium]|nr:class I SAM-dependent methyltransferase [Candidatus Dormibacteraeota bacterium]
MRQQLQRSGRALYRKLKVRLALSGLADSNRELATAIVNAADGKVSETEKALIDKIESLRERLSASLEELEITDYGARSGDANLTEEDMYRGKVIRRTVGAVGKLASRASSTALLLFRLVRELRPDVCIELGTSVGISGCYEASALKVNSRGRLITLEGADSIASVAKKSFEDLGLDNVTIVRGRFQDTLPGVLSSCPPVNYAFIDGHHDRIATVNYFHVLLPALADKAVVVFDDIQWSAGMRVAWAEIKGNERVRVSVDLGSMGLVCVGANGPPRHFNFAY